MLTIEFLNVSHGADVSNYDVRVLVNGSIIHTERITNHLRASGWKALVLRLVDREFEAALQVMKATGQLPKR
jgi:hypothetical protein